MCLAVPGRIVEIYEQDNLRMGKLDFGGMVRKACLQYVPAATVGDYALIHVGFALATISPEEAARTLDLIASLGGEDLVLDTGAQESPSDRRQAS